MTIHKSWLWPDSTIVLAWTGKQPHGFKPFASTRLAEVIEYTTGDVWLHVSSNQNPADYITCGIPPSKLRDQPLWWHDLQWLIQPQQTWPSQPISHSSDTEIKCCHVTSSQNDLNQSLLTRYGSYLKIIHVTSYIRRFIHYLKSINCSSRLNGPLLPTELDVSFNLCPKVIQFFSYPAEISSLSQDHPTSSKSTILSLRPFLEYGLLRVGGHLEHSLLSFGIKHHSTAQKPSLC